ncbi:MAG: XTP/dITP diphosphatase [Bacillota bacterium]|nr:XTP/dITP diphosphatase [Bacillota bacterium]
MILVLATRNEHKVREIRQVLGDLPVTILSARDFPSLPPIEERGRTFQENALHKARTVAEHTGHLALADDSGLEVDALGGQPGVFSARFAGEGATDRENNEKLLRLLAACPEEARTARFRCVLALADPAGWADWVEGVCEGRIGYEERGSGGFGYDPLFIVAGLGKTMAELSPEEKNAVSHRGQALRAARARWGWILSR